MLETFQLLKVDIDLIAIALEDRAKELGKKQDDLFKRSEKLTEAISKLDPELDREAIDLIKSTQLGDEDDIEEYFDSVDFLDIIEDLQQIEYPSVEDAQKWRLEPYPWPDGSTSPLQTLP